jgi:hypothetical protein
VHLAGQWLVQKNDVSALRIACLSRTQPLAIYLRPPAPQIKFSAVY